MSARRHRRAHRSLLLSGVVVAAGIASVALCTWLLSSAPPLPVTAALTVAPLVLAVLATTSTRVCRAHTAVLVVAFAVAGVAVALDLGLVVMLLVLGRMPVGIQHDVVVAAVAGMLLVAAIAGPLGRWTGRSARTALGGARRSPDELLGDLADRAGRGAPLPDLLRQLAESVRRDWAPATVQIWSADADADVLARTLVVPAALDGAAQDPAPLQPDELRVLARVGVAGPGWLRLWLPRLLPGPGAAEPQLRLAPAVHGDRVLALIVVERPTDAQAFSAADERALAEVARRLAIVLRNRALDEALQATLADLRRSNSDLQASRTRLVAAADAERKRIERDLHDGAQQHLVALAVGLRIIRDDLPDLGPDTELLDELDRGVREAIQALRHLAHGIYPPLLRDAGLCDALRAAAERNPLRVTLRGGKLERLPEQVETAVYFCCLEALQNAAKHAAGSAVTITLERDQVADGAPLLRFAVTDDGPGFDIARARRGSGLQGMADRLGAVGGTVALRSGPGQGTTVAGRVPLGAVGSADATGATACAAGPA